MERATAARSVTALDKVETLTLDAAGFTRLCEGNPAVNRFLLMVLSNRLRETSLQLLEARYVAAEHASIDVSIVSPSFSKPRQMEPSRSLRRTSRS